MSHKKYDRRLLSSLEFGLYLSVIGVAMVFATLLMTMAVSETINKLFSTKTSAKHKIELKKVSALAATYFLLDQERIRPPRLAVTETSTNWSAVAKMEALSEGVDRTR